MSYTYENPIVNGYLKIDIPRKIWNKIYPNCALRWFEYNEYYVNDNSLVVHSYYRILPYINLICFPINLLAQGLANYKEVWQDTIKGLNQQKYGSFGSHTIWKSHWSEDLANVIFVQQFKSQH